MHMYVYCSHIESKKNYSKSEFLILNLEINISILKIVI